jgi:hypothetical protein
VRLMLRHLDGGHPAREAAELASAIRLTIRPGDGPAVSARPPVAGTSRKSTAISRGWDRGIGPRALIACAPRELHTFGLIAFGIALHDIGWRITLAPCPRRRRSQRPPCRPRQRVLAAARTAQRRTRLIAELSEPGRNARTFLNPLDVRNASATPAGPQPRRRSFGLRTLETGQRRFRGAGLQGIQFARPGIPRARGRGSSTRAARRPRARLLERNTVAEPPPVPALIDVGAGCGPAARPTSEPPPSKKGLSPCAVAAPSA